MNRSFKWNTRFHILIVNAGRKLLIYFDFQFDLNILYGWNLGPLRAGGCVCCIHWASDSAWFNSRSQHWHFKSEDFMRPCPLLFVYSAGQCVDRGSARGQQRSGKYPAVWRSHWPMLMMGERFVMNSRGTSGTDHQHVLAQPFIGVFINLKNG